MILQTGGRAAAFQADVADYSSCCVMTEQTVGEFGRLDVVFANAGIAGGDEVTKMTADAWMHVIQVNLTGIFFTCKAVAPFLIANGSGAIVTMASSMAAWDVSLTGAAYMASKAGVVGLTKSLALQLAPHRIRVNAVCPGIIQTNLERHEGMTGEDIQNRYSRFARRIPLRRVGTPEDVAAAVAFLASEDAGHITGSALLIDGGQTLQSWSNAPDEDAYPLFTER